MPVVGGHLLIDLHPDSIDDITRANLKALRDEFKTDLKKERPNVFHSDPVKDKKEIRKRIRAFNLTIEYLGVKR